MVQFAEPLLQPNSFEWPLLLLEQEPPQINSELDIYGVFEYPMAMAQPELSV